MGSGFAPDNFFFLILSKCWGKKAAANTMSGNFSNSLKKINFPSHRAPVGGGGAVGLHPPGSPAPLLFSPNSLPLPTGVPTWVPHFACRAVPSPSEVHLLGHREEDVHCFVSFALQNADVVILVPGGAFLRRACTRVLLNYLQPPPPGRAGLR